MNYFFEIGGCFTDDLTVLKYFEYNFEKNSKNFEYNFENFRISKSYNMTSKL